MPADGPSGPAGRQQKTLIFEVTQRCSQDCLHCYNVWKNEAPYPAGELSTDETLAMLDKVLGKTKATQFDDADVRRRCPTVHRRKGNEAAILLGDFLRPVDA